MKNQIQGTSIKRYKLLANERIHSQCFHQQTIAETLIAENFMGIVGDHRYKAIELS
jgi:hypothetical protein